MLYKLIYLPESRLGLREAMDFLKKTKVPLEKIKEIRSEILTKADQLKVNPNIGSKEELLSGLSREYKKLICSHYKVIYFIDGQNVVVTDIFDSRQDPRKMRG